MERLNLDRRECSMCRTWSFSSSASAFVHPSRVVPSGRTANRVSSNTDERLETECSLSSVAGRKDSRFGASDGSDGSSGSSVVLVSSSMPSVSGGVIVYVGWRLTQVPK